jgi:hypothetical protein
LKSILVLLASCFVGVLGLCGLAVAEFNLLGVPMLEKSAMDPDLGWGGLVVAILCFVVAIALARGGDRDKG